MTRDEQQRFYDDTVAALSQGDRIAQLEAQVKQLRAALKRYVDADVYKGGYTAGACEHNERLSSGKFVLYGDQMTREAPNDLNRKAGASHV